jgi:2-dehydro-3-deoxygalactonokinase
VVRVIGVDWGGTNLRVFIFRDDGSLAETRRSDRGIQTIKDGGFERVLLSLLPEYESTALPPILCCGMAGGRGGWVEAPYIACPAKLDDLAQALKTPSTTHRVSIVPGLSTETADGLRDVMRGEETQIFGALDLTEAIRIVAPGTHSKWATIERGAITAFRTFMTGELFALLLQHSLLGSPMQRGAPDPEAFARGAVRGLETGASLSLLFSARTDWLFGTLKGESLSDYLSGLLIGMELAEMRAREADIFDAPIAIVGAGDLSQRYKSALTLAGAGLVTRVDGEEAAARGLWKIAQIGFPS